MIGNHLGERYELTLLLQENALFASYVAKDKVLGREVTVRVLKPPFNAEPAFLEKLGSVVKDSGAIQHPGVERLLELHQDGAVWFLVSEFSRGSSLAERIRKLAPYSVPASVAMIVEVLEALSALHSAGSVHGDPGAHNIVVQADGLARLELPGLWEAYAASETAASVMLPAMAPYLAPEVSAGGSPSLRSDTYAVGVVLFQLLTGTYPYPGETAVAVAMKHANTATPSAKQLNPAVPVSLDELLKRAMAKDPARRFSDAAEMLTEMRRIEGSVRFGKSAPTAKTSEPTTATQTIVPPKPTRRSAWQAPEEKEPRDVPVWMIVFFTFVLAVSIALVGVWWFFNSSAPTLVKVPDIRGKSREAAEQLLVRHKLQLRIVSREPSEKLPADSILALSPEPGQMVREGGVIAVKVSLGSQMVKIPELRGRTPDQARELLAKMNLDLDRVQDTPDAKVPRGLIARQTPEAGQKVDRFSRVNVWVSAGIDQPPVSQPAVASNSRYLYTMRIRLTKIDEPVTLRVDMTDANGTRTIHEAQHYPNQEVSIRAEGFGPEAIFRIYYNGEFVSQVNKRADESNPSTPAASGDQDAGPPSQDDGQ